MLRYFSGYLSFLVIFSGYIERRQDLCWSPDRICFP